jgi:FixJ family two-component response regulator
MTTGADAFVRPRILLVEDEPTVRRSLQLLLQAAGYDTRSFASAEALLAETDTRGIACLVADYRMPGLDGLGLLGVLRGRGWDGPAILVTGFGSPALTGAATAAGFSAVMEKPLSGPRLLDTLARIGAAGGR